MKIPSIASGFRFLFILALSYPAISATAAELRLEFLGVDSGGVPLMKLSGDIPGVYRIEASPDLVDWQPVGTQVLIGNHINFIDGTNSGFTKRFYRAVLLERADSGSTELLLRFKNTATDAGVGGVLGAMTVEEEIFTQAMQDEARLPILCVTSPLPTAQAIQQLAANPNVEFVEPNYVVTHMATSNDPRFTNGSLWGMYGDLGSPANAYGSQASEAWAEGYTGSSQVYVGVIDTGIQLQHPDLGANIWTNPFEIAANGIDDDGNGYVDDIRGWDFYHNDNSVFDGLPTSPTHDKHGTHVAGTIGAVGGNGTGVAGINWNVTLISGKFLGPDGKGSLSNAIKAIDYFTTLKQKHGLNIVATNNSWGGAPYSSALREAIVRAAKANILFVAAAGNEDKNIDDAPSYPAAFDTSTGASPAAYDAVISVAAIDIAGLKSSFSNYGSRNVDLGASGSAIWSTAPWLAYASLNGTSMAAPHVTGAAALYASTHPGATAAQIKTALLGSTTPTPSLAGKSVTGGRLNLSTVVRPASPVIVPPSALTGAVAGNGSTIFLGWTDHSSNETSFVVERAIEGGAFSILGSANANQTQFADVTISTGVCYIYRIKARNALGDSVPSNAARICTLQQPTNLTGAAALDESAVFLAWADNSSDETEFVVERRLEGKPFSSLGTRGANQPQFADVNTAPGGCYIYRVRAKNARGSSEWSNAARICTLRSPTGFTGAAAANGSAVFFAWTDQSSHESQYEIERAVAGGPFARLGKTGANQTAFADVTVARGVCYHYRLRAVNTNGASGFTGPIQICVP